MTTSNVRSCSLAFVASFRRKEGQKIDLCVVIVSKNRRRNRHDVLVASSSSALFDANNETNEDENEENNERNDSRYDENVASGGFRRGVGCVERSPLRVVDAEIRRGRIG